MKLNERISRHIQAKKLELDAVLDQASEAASVGWRDELIATAIELQKEICAAEALQISALKKGVKQ